ncbi:SGNH/GDSL hydrolase family protein [soil metagenome]
MPAIRHRRRLTGAAAIAVVLILTALSGCTPPPDTSVALGDSYVSGPLIPVQGTDPAGCLRSNRNWPTLTRPQIKVTKFKDVSCSGAATADMFAPQDVTPGPANPPQLDALDNMTKVVSVGIGGNDIGFVGIIQECALENPFGPGCNATYVQNGRDELRERIAATAPKIAQVLQAIKDRAPRAEVFISGYPTIIPETGNGCYPVVPILPQDIPYLRGVAKALNTMIRDQAIAAGVHYIDLARPSVGHDVCQRAGVRWVEGLIPQSPAAPVHPNAAGMAASATEASARINFWVRS